MTDRMSAIARAVLYEGYILWPYRRGSLKNRQRWTFGAVMPRAWSEEHPDDLWELRSEVLVEGPPQATVSATLRFLHVVERRVRDASGDWADELDVDGERHLSWQEATERELEVGPATLEEMVTGLELPLQIAADAREEPLGGAGAIVRSWRALEGSVAATGERLGPDLYRLGVRVRNETAWCGGDRQDGLAHSLVSTHVAWHAQDAQFVSLTDPPDALRDHACACTNVGTWPVLAGEPGDRSTILSAPIILEDHPRIAPESPGDMFDGGEIDQMLILNILAMSDAERREMRASDPRAREILDRCAAMGAEDLMRLHGTIREFGPVGET